MFYKVPHAFMQRFLMSVPEMQRFPFRLQAISASKFEGSPNRFEGHRLTPSAIKNRIAPRCAGESVRSYSTLIRWEARCAPPPGSPNITRHDAGMILCIRRLSCEVQSLSSGFYPAYLLRNVADMIDQGRLVPSFLSHLEITMCTGQSSRCRNISEIVALRLQCRKRKALLPILVP